MLALNGGRVTVVGMENEDTTRQALATDLGIGVEYIADMRESLPFIFFRVRGADYSCRVTQRHRVKKNSIRKD